MTYDTPLPLKNITINFTGSQLLTYPRRKFGNSNINSNSNSNTINFIKNNVLYDIMTKELAPVKDSNGDYTCPICGKCYLQESLALECLASHEGDRDVLVLDRVKTLASPVNKAFGSFDGSANTVGINERLVSLMFEDYLLSREQDIVSRGKVSPLSMQLSKNLNDAVTNLNKLKYGTKSLSVKVSEKGPTDAMDILEQVS